MLIDTARAINAKLRSQFPDSPDGRFMFAIVERAILDLTVASEREEAYIYITSPEIPHAEICEISSEWIHRLLLKAGLIL